MTAGGAGGFGPLLRGKRLAAGLTQAELARRAGLSTRSVGDLERGRTGRPYLRTVTLLAQALRLDQAGRDELARAARAGYSPAPAATQGPRQLPASAAGFAGRQAELGVLSSVLGQVGVTPGTVVVSAVGGIAGVGKTTLAVRWAHHVADQFPDGQLHVNLRGFGPGGPPLPPATVIRDFLDALGVPAERVPAQPEARAGLYRSLMAGRRMLVLLDNARDSGQVIPLLPGSSGCLVLVTSRSPLTALVADGARQVALDVLSEAEARDLLALRLGTRRVAREPAAADQIVTLTGRLPLALSIVTARAAAHPAQPLAALASELADERHRLDALEGGELSADVRAAFSWSYQQLSPPASRMFRLLGLHSGPEVTIPAAASLAGVSRAAARQALAELTVTGLLTEPAPGRYGAHDLVRVYAAELSQAGEPAGQRAEATGRLLAHYMHSSMAAWHYLIPGSGGPDPGPLPSGVVPEVPVSHAQAVAWFAAERPALIAAIAAAAGSGPDFYAQQLPFPLAEHLSHVGRWQDWSDIMTTSLAAARRRGDTDTQGWALRSLGASLIHVGRLEDAVDCLNEAMRLFTEVGNDSGLGRARHAMTIIFQWRKQYDQALEYARLSVAAYRRCGEPNGLALALNAVGWALTSTGEHDQALECCQEAHQLCEQTGNRGLGADVIGTMGIVHLNRGDYDLAIARAREAVAAFRDRGQTTPEAEYLIVLGDALRASGDTGGARRTWRQALRMLDDTNHAMADGVRTRIAGTGQQAGAAGY
jgi:tetratricopeptide (TPR) repeat protein/transcriptional regulator with XRE-family HTH domain